MSVATTMRELDRERLVKLLRMFSSDFDGEIASAARRVHELLRSRDLDWNDLIIPSHSGRPQTPRQVNSRADDIECCRELGKYLTRWEAQFVGSIAISLRLWGRLTPKQAAVLDHIIRKLKGAGLWSDKPW